MVQRHPGRLTSIGPIWGLSSGDHLAHHVCVTRLLIAGMAVALASVLAVPSASYIAHADEDSTAQDSSSHGEPEVGNAPVDSSDDAPDGAPDGGSAEASNAGSAGDSDAGSAGDSDGAGDGDDPLDGTPDSLPVPAFDDSVESLEAELLATGSFAGDPDDPLMVDEPVTLDKEGASVAYLWMDSPADAPAGLEVQVDDVTLSEIDIRGDADSGLRIDGDDIEVRNSIIRAGSRTTVEVTAGSGVNIEDSVLGLPKRAGGSILTIEPGLGATRIDMDGTEFCSDCYERATDPQRLRGGNACASCIFLPGCGSGTKALNRLTFAAFDRDFRARAGSVTIDARRVYWGPGGPRMASNAAGRGIRIDAVPGIRVNVRPWLVSVIGPVGASIRSPAATRTYTLGKRPYALVPQGALVIITSNGRSMRLHPREDVSLTRLR